MAELPTGTVTFLFSDIEGSTKLLQRLGDAYAHVLGEHQALLRAAWAAHSGVEVDTQGDSFFVAFASAPEAAAAAAAATRALADHAWPEGGEVRVRIGLHTGTPQLAGDTYVGLDVHRAARIAAAGHGGQVLLSEATRGLVEQELPEGATLRDLGPHRLKDLQHAEHLYKLVLAGLPADFPALKSLDARPNNLPIQPTPLLGREEAVAAVCALLRGGARLVTLTGPGGIGKTRLSIQVAAEVLDDYADGVWFVRLSRLTDPSLVIPTVAQTLGLREQGATPVAETLHEHLRARHTLLMLDNFEQVVGAAPEIAALLETCPGLKVLATSRVPLRLRGEQAFPVAPLPLAGPDARSPEQLGQYAAVVLFIQRAREARPDFAVTAANAPAIADICARLDGLPLAIELAAARVRLLPPEELLARLSSRLLTGGARDTEERQRTMHAAIAWSEGLLGAEERVLFRRLAAFAGGCTVGAAEAVCAAPEGVEPLGIDVLEGLGTLADHSLVQPREEGGEARFAMLHTVREYALERLEASGEAEALHRAHAASCLALAERVEPWLVGGPRLREALGLLEREYDNLRAALTWALRAGEATLGLRLAGAMEKFWFSRQRPSEGQQWLEGLLALQARGGTTWGTGSAPTGHDAAPGPVRAKALYGAGELATQQGDFGRAEPLLKESLALARAAGDATLMMLVLNRAGYAAMMQGDLGRATTRLEECLALARQLGDPLLSEMPLLNLSVVAYARGDLHQADVLGAEAVAMDRRARDMLWLPNALASWANVRRRQGDLHQALALLREAFAVRRDTGERAWPGEIEVLAGVLGAAGQGERAARLLGAAAGLREALGTPQVAYFRADVEQEARAALGEEAWAAAFAAGRTLSLEEAVAEALGEGEDRSDQFS